MVATCAYIDLNPVAAGMNKLPKESEHTSIKARIDHCREKGRLDDLRAAQVGTVAGVKATRGLEKGLWLCPIEDARHRGAERPGLLEDFGLGSYLQLMDYTSRLLRSGKARVSRDAESLLSRIGTSAEVWNCTLQKMFKGSGCGLIGLAFAFSKEKLATAAKQRDCHHIDNLSVRAI